ncbi:MAG: sigma-70 family RNA polymerase sigma factor [Myxococcota bacterium]
MSTAETRAREKARDRAWVEAARRGDRRAYGKLVDAYQRRVYALAFGIVRQPDDAWDVAQEAFVKAYRNLEAFNGESSFFTWLYRITTNLAIDHVRARKRRRTDGLDAAPELPADASADPDHHLGRDELARVLRAAMDQLSEKHRAIIVLREIEGLSYDEMAEVLGIRKGTVMSRLFHARQNLQEILRPYVAEGDGVPGVLRLSEPKDS